MLFDEKWCGEVLESVEEQGPLHTIHVISTHSHPACTSTFFACTHKKVEISAIKGDMEELGFAADIVRTSLDTIAVKNLGGVCVCVRACVLVCVCACMRACVRASFQMCRCE